MEPTSKKSLTSDNSGSSTTTPERITSRTTAISDAERRQVLQEWNRTTTAYPELNYLPVMIEKQAERTPDAEAVRYEGEILSYRQLNQKANQLAGYLKKLGVGPDTRVGVCAERCTEMVVALLGIWKAGGAYVPLDPDYPAERLRWMLEDAQLPILLTQSSVLKGLSSHQATVFCLDRDFELLGDALAENLPSAIVGANAAYVIYTSGSTGRPKGVVNTHAGIRNRLLWMQEKYQLTPADRVLQKTSFSFDVSVWEFFWPLLAGAGLVLTRPGGQKDSRYLVETIQKQGITTLHFVPSMLSSFLDELEAGHCSTLRHVICSGEALPAALAERFHKSCQARLHNLYGPTEAAIDVTFWECLKNGRSHTVPIGRPIANTQMYVLDAEMQPVQVGAEGELYIGGEGLARGYLNRPDLTAQRFLPDPFGTAPGARFYRTGDLGRWTAEGAIEFLGRSDNQVKIRGYRIELEEIETALQEHPEVRDAVVVARANGPGPKQLVAYVVPQRSSARYVLGKYRLPNGLSIAHQNKNETDYLYQEIFASRTYFRNGIRLKENACVFDIGANIGMFALFVSENAPNARIYAFEPLPPAFETLQFNASLCVAQVKVFGFGLSDRERTEDFIFYPRNTMMSGQQEYADREQDISVVKKVIENEQRRTKATTDIGAQIDELLTGRFDQKTYRCQVRKLSDVMAEQGIDHIDLLKVDVERAELDVLRGIHDDDWTKIEQIVVEVEDKPGSSSRLAEIADFLRKRSYHVTIEEDERLKGSGLYNLYASRSHGTATEAENLAVDSRNESSEAEQLSVSALRNHLARKLPEYMVPSAFVFLNTLPLTVNGKLDRNALPAPSEERPVLEQPYVAPRNQIEEQLSRIWSEVLHISQVGVHDNFLHLGGHSLLAAQVISQVQKSYGVQLSLRNFFDKPTLAELAELVQLNRRETANRTAAPIVRAPRGQDIPLSFSQERVWFLLQFEPTSIAYHFQAKLRISGPLDVAALERSLSEMVRRHEILRTTFTEKDGHPVQVIHEARPIALPVVKVEADGRKSAAEALDLLIRQELQTRFDIAQLPLIRWKLFSLDEQEFVLLDVEHHLVHDGWGFNVFIGELLTIYKSFASGQPSPLPPPPLQFADFAYWQRQAVASEHVQAQLAYWKDKLSGAQPVSELPADRPRPPIQTFHGGLLRIALPLPLSREVRFFSKSQNTSLFVTMMTAFFSLIYRYSRQDDLNVGSTIANRQQPGTEGLLGMIVDNLVLRARIPAQGSFRDLLSDVRNITLEAYENQEVPFQQVVRNLGLDRNLGVNPLFQVMFNFHTAPLSVPEIPELTFELTEALGNNSAKFDLGIIVIPSFEARLRLNPAWDKDDLIMMWEFNTDLFDEETIQRMIGHYQTLLQSVIINPDQPIGEASLLTETERQEIRSWNRTQREFNSRRCVHELFEDQAAQTPHATAIEHAGEKLSYQELNQQANQLARQLRALGAGQEVRIGISTERSPAMVISLLAVLKAGGAYVPMDPALPAERLEYILEDAYIAILVIGGTAKTSVTPRNAQIVRLTEDWKEISRHSNDNLEPVAGPDNLAYVMYTSGSTGKPKGVMIQHRSLINLLESVRRDLQIIRQDTLLALTTLSFDIAALEIFSPLLAGGKLLIGDPMQEEIPNLVARVREQQVTIMQATPTLWKILAEQPWQSLARELTILSGGEALEKAAAEQLLRISKNVWNMYGPTETTVWSSMCQLEDVPGGIAPIGKPIANTEMYVLDENMALTPAGVAGHLYIGGAGLARGYVNQPGLTAEKFCPNPFSTMPGERLYNTGDLAKWRPDGVLEFIGRKDHQVKLRGYRIELGEIEAVLLQHPQIKNAVVLVKGDDEKESKRLLAYLVTAGGASISTPELQVHMKKSLPEYMVPSQFVLLEQMPLMPSGKIDRKALAERQTESAAAETKEAAARSDIERALTPIWTEILGINRAGIHDNFFVLGGHSLLALQIISRIRDVYGVTLPLRVMFQRPTIALLANGIEQALADKALAYSEPETLTRAQEPMAEPLSQLKQELLRNLVESPGMAELAAVIPRQPKLSQYPASFVQSSFWFASQLDAEAAVYAIVRAFRLSGPLDASILKASCEALINRHSALRTTFHAGEDGPMQTVAGQVQCPFSEVSVKLFGASGRNRVLAELIQRESRKTFDLGRGPMLRFLLAALGQQEYAFIVVMHHIVIDDWSIQILFRELSALYSGLSSGRAALLPELPIEYTDFAVWQHELHKNDRFSSQADYWKQQLADMPPPLNLSSKTSSGAFSLADMRVTLPLPMDLWDRLKNFCQAGQVTLFEVLLTAFEVLLGYYTGRDDLAIATVVSNRDRKELESLVGCLTNTVILRLRPDADATFHSLLKQVRGMILQAQNNKEVPFEHLLQVLQTGRMDGYVSLVNVLFALQNAPDVSLSLPGIRTELIAAAHAASTFDLSLVPEQTRDGLNLVVQYNTTLFEDRMIQRLFAHYTTLLTALATDPDQRISEISLLGAEEKGSQASNGISSEATPMPDWFEARAALAPDDTAIIFGAQRLSYRELNERADKLATHLIGLGAGAEVRIAICLQRSVEMIVAMLGVLKSGAAYVPLDPAYPAERLRYMLQDSGSELLITQRALMPESQAFSGKVIQLDLEWKQINAIAPNAARNVHPENIAYLIYTSGSTGKPKGTAIRHRSLSALIEWTQDAFPAEELSGVLASTSICFDLSVFEILATLSCGGCVVLVENAFELTAAMADHPLTLINTVPSIMRELVRLKAIPPLVRTINVAGEPLSAELVRSIHACNPALRIFNLYGPTEDTTYSTYALLPRDYAGKVVPIGKPIMGTSAHVLNHWMQPVPEGIIGELYLGGEGLARGYFNRPDLTAERFVPDPFSAIPGARLYRTGDLVRFMPDGNLDFRGRVDLQVKVRGYRIELGEIQAVLEEHPSAGQAVAIIREGERGGKRLLAYVTSKNKGQVNPGELIEYLRTRLPHYMVPDMVVPLASLPLTVNGKIDRGRLPEPAEEVSFQAVHTAPRTPEEETLCKLWSEVLQKDPIGVDQDFFALGGHSLLALQVSARAREAFGLELPFRVFFEARTVAGLAAYITRQRGRGQKLETLLNILQFELRQSQDVNRSE